ncbi:ATP--guanido phosphotransferase, partial [Bacillus sp. V59.32b]
MSLEHFLENAISSWMNEEGPDSDIVLSSRVRLARNFKVLRQMLGWRLIVVTLNQ